MPSRRRNIVARDGLAVAGGHLEGEALPVEEGVALPILTPVSRHCLPSGLRPLDSHRVDVACASHIGDQHQIEVGVPVNGEPNPSFLDAGDSVVISASDLNDGV